MKKENETLKQELKIVKEQSRNTTLNASMVSVRDRKISCEEGQNEDREYEIIRLTKENAKLKRFKQEVRTLREF